MRRPDEVNFTCPCCFTVARHPLDIHHTYCSRCHWYTGDPELGPVHLSERCQHRQKPVIITGGPHDGLRLRISVTTHEYALMNEITPHIKPVSHDVEPVALSFTCYRWTGSVRDNGDHVFSPLHSHP